MHRVYWSYRKTVRKMKLKYKQINLKEARVKKWSNGDHWKRIDSTGGIGSLVMRWKQNRNALQKTNYATGVYASFSKPWNGTRALKNNHVTHETGTMITQDYVYFVLSAMLWILAMKRNKSVAKWTCYIRNKDRAWSWQRAGVKQACYKCIWLVL